MLDEAAIVANLAANQEHIELLLIKLKLQAAVHDYVRHGSLLGDFYTTMIAA